MSAEELFQYREHQRYLIDAMSIVESTIMKNLVLVKPSGFELNDAIFSFSDGAPESTPEDMERHLSAIMGEACFLIEAGKTIDEVISHFSSLGLSEGCARPFVEKAVEVVSWNSKEGESGASAAQSGSTQLLGIVVPIAVAGVLLLYVLYSLFR